MPAFGTALSTVVRRAFLAGERLENKSPGITPIYFQFFIDFVNTWHCCACTIISVQSTHMASQQRTARNARSALTQERDHLSTAVEKVMPHGTQLAPSARDDGPKALEGNFSPSHYAI